MCVIYHSLPCVLTLAIGFRHPLTASVPGSPHRVWESDLSVVYLMCRVGWPKPYLYTVYIRVGLAKTIYVYGICTVFLAGKSLYKRSYTVHIQYFWQGNHCIYGHLRCIYSIFGREFTVYMVIYGAYIRFWPTVLMCHVRIVYRHEVWLVMYVVVDVLQNVEVIYIKPTRLLANRM